MAKKVYECAACGKKPLSRDEIGITKKLTGLKARDFYCLDCLANYLDADRQDILDKIEEFKNEGCRLFV